MNETMNIYAKPGHKVIVTEESAKNGYRADQDKIRNVLEIGKVYIVDSIDVGDWETTVYLEGQTLGFNSVNFEDYEDPDELKKIHAVAFAQWIHKYASKMGHKWGVYGTDKPIRSTEELYELFINSQK